MNPDSSDESADDLEPPDLTDCTKTASKSKATGRRVESTELKKRKNEFGEKKETKTPKKTKQVIGELVSYDGSKSTRKFLYELIDPDGWPIYIGQTVKERERFAAHCSKNSKCTLLKDTISSLKKTHPKWKACDNFRRIECVKSGVPHHLADRYEGFFIVGIKQADPNQPGTRWRPEFPLRSNSQDGPNWWQYRHFYDKMKAEVEKANDEGVEIEFNFKSSDKFHIKDPQYEDAFGEVAVMEAAMEHLAELDEQPTEEFTQRFDIVKRTVCNHESAFTLDKAIKDTIAVYKDMEESAVDGKTFVSQWNHAKSLIVDYVPNPENPCQEIAHKTVLSCYKNCLSVIGNGDFETLIDRKTVIGTLELLQQYIKVRTNTGGLPARSFISMMSWCKLDSDLGNGENPEKKLMRLREKFEKEVKMNDYQKAELDSRIQACLQRIEEDKKKGAVTVVDESAELSEAATSLS